MSSLLYVITLKDVEAQGKYRGKILNWFVVFETWLDGERLESIRSKERGCIAVVQNVFWSGFSWLSMGSRDGMFRTL
jgi:hypothetical protein